MNIFKQMYTVRRYKDTSWDSGTAETTYSDMQLPLDVQATSYFAASVKISNFSNISCVTAIPAPPSISNVCSIIAQLFIFVK